MLPGADVTGGSVTATLACCAGVGAADAGGSAICDVAGALAYVVVGVGVVNGAGVDPGRVCVLAAYAVAGA